jgi:pyrimidine deaminase RibD-like protein
MEAHDAKFMEEAVALAGRCNPVNDWIPRVGAVIAVKGTRIAEANRGSGAPGDDDHAELNALKKVQYQDQLAGATIYTTLEPCTPDVRSDPLHCCTEQILRAKIGKVYIGILDPNQGVTGKGIWQLQTHGVEVELFPAPFPERIRAINREFIRLQQTYGIKITNPKDGAIIETYKTQGAYQLEGTFENEPGQDVVGFSQFGDQWWPQSGGLTLGSKNTWRVRFHFGGYGTHRLHIVKASPLAMHLVTYYRKIRDENLRRIGIIRERLAKQPELLETVIKGLPGSYPGISIGGSLPKGLQSLDTVTVEIAKPPA